MKKTVVLGVTGGIAAYKACELTSSLVKKNLDVHVIMTKHAEEFVSALTFQSLSQNYVVTDMFEQPKSWDIEHIALAKRADVFAIVPATANIIGKMASGIADDMLSTTVMATTAPIVLAPAMNTKMYENPMVQSNIEKLRSFGYHFVDPAFGRLACADIGQGKLAEVSVIEEHILFHLYKSQELRGKKVMVTAGPTREAIDPVRYITNHSSGKMGYAIAREAAMMGGEVTLISGPVNIEPSPLIQQVVRTSSAQEMYQEVTKYFTQADIVVKAAAVADYRPQDYSDSKIKKTDDDLMIRLSRNKDIAMELGKIKKHQVIVGFAAETDDFIENAKKKLKKKNFDFVVLNDIRQEGAGFEGDTNIVKFVEHENVEELPMMSKNELAVQILRKAVSIRKDAVVER